MKNRKSLIKELSKIIDPEVGLDIVTMGLIYNAKRSDDKLEIDMTMTTPYCPLQDYFDIEVKKAAKIFAENKLKINFIFDPAWSPNMIDRKE
ncbi:metal-sulfur cluster assembly factor [Patescibacteria group bacterium]